MIALVEQNREAIAELCRTYGVYKLDLFGSAATGAFQPEKSDLDFVVNFWDRTGRYADRFLQLAESLEGLFDREVDLITEASVKSPLFKQLVDSQQETVFEDRSREAAARRADSMQ
jgi:predicted nucleotidyltransferase